MLEKEKQEDKKVYRTQDIYLSSDWLKSIRISRNVSLLLFASYLGTILATEIEKNLSRAYFA